jgi:hypothetical protein
VTVGTFAGLLRTPWNGSKSLQSAVHTRFGLLFCCGMTVRAGSAETGEVAADILKPPGRYGDGPVYIRVEKEIAGSWRPPVGHRVERNDWRCAFDPRFEYVEIVNTHNAFLYFDDMVNSGVPARALSVVRLADVSVES